MKSNIFREYDIRAVAGKEIDENDVLLIGKGIGSYLSRNGFKNLAVGKDCRTTSDLYAEKLIEGLLSTGCDVIEIGVCPSPVLYFAVQHLNTEGGVMVTASHNPKEYNGFKINKGRDSLHGEEIQKIRLLIEKQDFETGQGKRSKADVIPDYQDTLVNKIEIEKPLRIGVDAGNGTAGFVALPIFKRLGFEIHDLYCDMDGTFPNHEADPTVKKNMTDLIALVKKKKLDVGIGFDGDGDRIGVVDEGGNIIYGDKLITLFAREILSRKPGATFVSEVKCSQTMYDDIKKHGGNAIMWKTGHSLIKSKMKEVNAELAGEMSGHMFFKDRYFGFDDATYAALRLLEILSKTGKRISELLADLPKTYTTPEIRADFPDDIKFDVVKKVTDYFRDKYNVIDIDGVRVIFEDGWGLVRASNTQPALVLRFEALSEKRLDEIRNLIESVLKQMQN